MPPKSRHDVTITVEGKAIGGWTSYEIASSLVDPADGFTMSRPFSAEAWNLLPRDARVRVHIDGTVILDGFVDGRRKTSREGMLEIRGRDRAGRLVQESSPRVNYQGLSLVEAIKRLADPWFRTVTLSDARNRRLRLGKGRRRIPAGNEPLIVRRTANGAGKVQAGTMRWSVIQELASQAGLIAWSSADGRELFVGRPNHDQAPSFHFRKARRVASGGSSNVLDLAWDEDNGDRYSVIAVVGTGGGTEEDFGLAVSSRRAVVFDGGEDGGPNGDGTGRDFRYPKRLLLPERNFDSDEDASRVAGLEQARRDFRRTTITVEAPFHGQRHGPIGATLFAPNTVAMITDEDFDPVREENAMIFACTYRRTRDEGETTRLELVPAGTEIVL